MLPEGTFKFNINYTYENADRLIREGKLEDSLQKQISVKNRWAALSTGLEYGVTDRFSLSVAVPFNVNVREEGYKHNEYDAHGFGDLAVRGRYWFAKPDRDAWNFHGGLGLSVPTGDSGEKQSDGSYKKDYIQPGAGQWTILPSVGFVKNFGDLNFSGTVGYVWSLGEDDAKYDTAEATHVTLGVSNPFVRFGKDQQRILGGSFSMKGTFIPEHDDVDGVRVANTGGTWISAIPGLYFSPDGGKFTTYFAFSIPVFTEVHSLQCYSDYAVHFGITYHF